MGYHRGLDITTRPGQAIFAPIPGYLVKAITGNPLSAFKIIGEGDYKGITAYVFYAKTYPQYSSGVRVSSGTRVAEAQNVNIHYKKKIEGTEEFKVGQHVHLAIKKGSTYIDPENVVINLTPKSIS